MSNSLVITPFIERRRCERVSSAPTHAELHSTKNHLWKVIFGVVTIAMLASAGSILVQRFKSVEVPMTTVVPGPDSAGFYRWDGYHRIAALFNLKQS